MPGRRWIAAPAVVCEPVKAELTAPELMRGHTLIETGDRLLAIAIQVSVAGGGQVPAGGSWQQGRSLRQGKLGAWDVGWYRFRVVDRCCHRLALGRIDLGSGRRRDWPGRDRLAGERRFRR